MEIFKHEATEIMTESKFNVYVNRRDTDSKSIGCQLHWHEALEFFYVIAGGVEVVCNGIKSWLYAGDVGFVHWCNLHQSIRFLNGTSHYIIRVDIRGFLHNKSEIFEDNYYQRFTVNTKAFPTFIKGNVEICKIFDQIIWADTHKDFAYDLDLKSYIYSLLSLLLKLSNENIQFKKNENTDQVQLQYVRHALGYLHEHFCEKLDEYELSSQLNISRSYMCRVFKKHTGKTITQYMLQLRCQYASVLISKGFPVTRASVETGFEDYNYFSRVFKKVMGQSPKSQSPKSETAN